MVRYIILSVSALIISGVIVFAAMASAEASTQSRSDTPSGLMNKAPPSAPIKAASKSSPAPAAPKPPEPKPMSSPPRLPVSPLKGIDLSKLVRHDSHYIQPFEDKTVYFTMHPEMQTYTDDLFDRYDVPAGAAVMINSRTGRVITLSQQRKQRDAADSAAVAFDPTPPAASLFKIITTAALIEKGGVPLDRQTCYAGGSRELVMQHLLDQLPQNHACVSLTTALGSSINAVFAKLSDRYLSRSSLREYAERFGFNRPIAFDVPIKASNADIPSDRLERARTAAGFWHTHLSPLHAAVIAQSIAQDGAMLRPYVVDHVESTGGEVIYKSKPKYVRHTVSKETAELMLRAMTYTTRRGTARKSFRDRAGRPYVSQGEVAGKTGTLTGQKPYRAYTWFVGMAPADKPEVAIAVLVVNEPKWRIKAPQVAALLLKKYFEVFRKSES